MRLIYCLLIVLLISGCSAHKNTCIDLRHVESKTETPKLSKIKSHHTDESYLFTEPGRRIKQDYPVTASLKEESVELVQRPKWETSHESVRSPGMLDKKELKEKLKEWKRELSQKDFQTLPGDTTRTAFDQQYKEARTLAIISLASSIGSFVFFPLAIVAIITGVKSLKKYKKSLNKKGRGMAMAGLIIGIVSTVLFVLFILILLFVLIAFANSGF